MRRLIRVCIVHKLHTGPLGALRIKIQLSGFDILCRFSSFYTRDTTFMTYLSFTVNQVPSKRKGFTPIGVYSKRKEFAPIEFANSLLLN